MERSYCLECGRLMSAGDTHKRCRSCRGYNYVKEPKHVKHFDANEKLDRDAAEAFKLGMSYGQYKNMLYQKQLKGEE